MIRNPLPAGSLTVPFIIRVAHLFTAFTLLRWVWKL